MNSKAGHIPIRSCVICKTKRAQKELLGFMMMPSGIVYDLARRLQGRKQYVCPSRECVALLPKWQKRRAKGRSAK
ncbi:MAG: DUF448 domain-containing protein [Candidatus Cloacimonadaceae bacterium]